MKNIYFIVGVMTYQNQHLYKEIFLISLLAVPDGEDSEFMWVFVLVKLTLIIMKLLYHHHHRHYSVIITDTVAFFFNLFTLNVICVYTLVTGVLIV
jgi:hypothetical protein